MQQIVAVEMGDGNDKLYQIDFTIKVRDAVVMCGITELGSNGYPKPETLAAGISFCSLKDEFDAVKGKRVALHRALANSSIPRSHYEEVWNEWVRRHVTCGIKARKTEKQLKNQSIAEVRESRKEIEEMSEAEYAENEGNFLKFIAAMEQGKPEPAPAG